MLEKLKDIIFHRKPYLVTYSLTIGINEKYSCQETIKATSESDANYIINNKLKLLIYEIISIKQLDINGR